MPQESSLHRKAHHQRVMICQDRRQGEQSNQAINYGNIVMLIVSIIGCVTYGISNTIAVIADIFLYW